jgi:hypothetical protein
MILTIPKLSHTLDLRFLRKAWWLETLYPSARESRMTFFRKRQRKPINKPTSRSMQNRKKVISTLIMCWGSNVCIISSIRDWGLTPATLSRSGAAWTFQLWTKEWWTTRLIWRPKSRLRKSTMRRCLKRSQKPRKRQKRSRTFKSTIRTLLRTNKKKTLRQKLRPHSKSCNNSWELLQSLNRSSSKPFKKTFSWQPTHLDRIGRSLTKFCPSSTPRPASLLTSGKERKRKCFWPTFWLSCRKSLSLKVSKSSFPNIKKAFSQATRPKSRSSSPTGKSRLNLNFA